MCLQFQVHNALNVTDRCNMMIDVEVGVTQEDPSTATCQYQLLRQYLTKSSFFLFRVMPSFWAWVLCKVHHTNDV